MQGLCNVLIKRFRGKALPLIDLQSIRPEIKEY